MTRSVQLALSLTLLACLSSVHAKGHGVVVRVAGDVTVESGFSALSLTPVNGDCLIVVEGVVTLTGTLHGIAFSRTRALAAAWCDEVASRPRGATRRIAGEGLAWGTGFTVDFPAERKHRPVFQVRLLDHRLPVIQTSTPGRRPRAACREARAEGTRPWVSGSLHAEVPHMSPGSPQ